MKHRLQVLAAALLFSTGGAAIKAISLTSWQVAGVRSGIAAGTVLLLAREARRGWGWRILPLAVAYAGTLTLFVLSNKLTTSANAIFLQSTAPLYVMLLGPLVLREPLRVKDMLFMAPVALGLTLFFLGAEQPLETAPDPPRGNVLALASGACWALTVTGIRWLGRQNADGAAVSALPVVAAGNLLAFAACMPAAIPLADVSATDWSLLLYLGIFQIGLAYLLLTSGLRQVTALEASTLLMLEPALNPIWAWAIHGETPSTWGIAGGTLIIGATAARTWWDERGPPDAEPGRE